MTGANRSVDEHLKRIEDGQQTTSHLVEVVGSLIDGHQGDRHEKKNDEPRGNRRSSDK